MTSCFWVFVLPQEGLCDVCVEGSLLKESDSVVRMISKQTEGGSTQTFAILVVVGESNGQMECCCDLSNEVNIGLDAAAE